MLINALVCNLFLESDERKVKNTGTNNKIK